MIKLDSTEYRKQINLQKTNWKHLLTTNCCAFALGLDVMERTIMKDAYQPGTLTQHDLDLYFTFEQLINCLTSDLEYLKVDYREINPLDEIGEDEWKIALFVQIDPFMHLLSDFHFLRQINNSWYHKQGYHGFPTNKDSYNKIITDPTECYICDEEYQKTYSLKLKKN